MFYLIYKITNTMNNKEYIGSHKTDNIHDSYMGSGTAIRNAIKKHGKDNFVKEILHVFDTPDEMFAKEREIVTEDYIKRSDTYNLMVGGLGAGPGHLNPFYGKKHRPESIQQNIQTQKVKYENGHIMRSKEKRIPKKQSNTGVRLERVREKELKILSLGRNILKNQKS